MNTKVIIVGNSKTKNIPYDLIGNKSENIINSDIIKKMKKNNIVTLVYSEKNLKLSEAKELWSIGIKSLFIDDPSEFKIF